MASIEESAVDSAQIPDKILAATLSDLYNHLDSLWISYLHNLDQYTTSQKIIQKHMSAGFLSLARANFNARNGLRRFGPDSFHERAISSRRTAILIDETDKSPKVTIVQWKGDHESDQDTTGSQLNKEAAENRQIQQQPSQLGTPITRELHDKSDVADDKHDADLSLPDESSNAGDQHPTSSESNSTPRSNPAIDPLRWFGILVPPDLRLAQSSFVSVINDPISDSINSARRMREVEVEIRKVRKEVKRAEKAASR